MGNNFGNGSALQVTAAGSAEPGGAQRAKKSRITAQYIDTDLAGVQVR